MIKYLRENRWFFVGFLLVNIVLLVVFWRFPKFVMDIYDAQSYFATAGNIMEHGKFYNPLAFFTYPVGFSFVISPAFIFKSQFLRLFFTLVIQLVFVDLFLVVAYGFLKKFYEKNKAVVLTYALVLTPGIISWLMIRVFSETIFTVIICLAFIFYYYALIKNKGVYWFLVSFCAFFSYALRTMGLPLIFAFVLTMGLFVLIEKRKSVKPLIYSFAGGIVGYSPLIFQKISLWYHKPLYFNEHYVGFFDRYMNRIFNSFESYENFVQLLLRSTWVQYTFLSVLSLGGVLIILIYLKRFLLYSLANLKTDKVFAILFLFVFVVFGFQFGLSVLNGYDKIVMYEPYEWHTRLLLPLATFLLLSSVFFVKKYAEEMKILRKHWALFLVVLFALFLTSAIAFPTGLLKGFSFHFFTFWPEKFSLPGDAATYILVISPFLLYFLWMRKKVNYLMLLILSVVLFSTSFFKGVESLSNIFSNFQSRGYDIESDLYNHEIFQNDGIENVFMLYPAEKNKDLYVQYVRISYKKDYRYHGMVYDEFFELPEEERANSIVFVGSGYEFGCEKLKEGEIVDLYYCNEFE